MLEHYSSIEIELDHGVCRAVIDNPPLNLLDARLLRDLDALAADLCRRPDVRVVVFASADPDFFIPHGDMGFVDDPQAFASLPVGDGEDERLNPMQRVFERVRKLPQVTIGELAGFARGGGAEFLSALDMRFAAETKGRLAQMEAPTGIIPGSGATVYLPRLVGRARALEIILGAQLVDAPTAERYGWINRAVPDGELAAFVARLARRIADLPPGVAEAAKRAVDAPEDDLLPHLLLQNELLGETFAKPAATRLTRAALAAGAQTRSGERDLEAILSRLHAPE